MSWLIYGANGYTGELIAREAKRRGMTPILAARSGDKVGPLARELGLPMRAFPLDSELLIAEQLHDVSLVLHCAGPFSATSAPMLQACLRAKVHYLDISGEISTFEYAHNRHLEAVARGVVVCPGVGFDVVPTDCLAAKLHAALPDADQLLLGFESRAGTSPGTLKTMIENLPLGGCIRKEGKLVEVPHGYRTRTVDFGAGEKLASTIPWGDVATGFYTTGIPNIQVYTPVPASFLTLAKLGPLVRFVTAPALVQALLKQRAGKVRGPSEQAREKHASYVWGEVKNPAGKKITGRIKTASGYALTVTAALGVVERVLAGEQAGGYYTPSKLMGADYVTTLPGSSPFTLE
jgi:short subunit dehydrogenase-like uncharacterized protein